MSAGLDTSTVAPGNTPALRQRCQDDGRILVASRHGRYPHTDEGVEVRRVFHIDADWMSGILHTKLEHFN